MRPETDAGRDNRAVSPLFKAFGGRLMVPRGDAVRMTDHAGSHRAEWIVLSCLVPLVVIVAVGESLGRVGGIGAALIGSLPLGFIALHLLSFLLGGGGPRWQFIKWSALLSLWALWIEFRLDAAPVLWVARLWLAFMALQGLSLLWLGWQALMRISGKRGLQVRIAIAVLAHLLIVAIGWHGGLAWGALAFVTMVIVWAIGTFIPTNQLFGPMPKRWRGEGPLLTIDDGPDPVDTPVILELLDHHQTKAVFFVIGEKVRAHPELAREIVARGHELGNHTLTHPQQTMWSAGPRRMWREIKGCSEAIEEVTGQKPHWFRAPVGHRNYFTHPVASALGMEVVAWSRRGFDTLNRPLERIVAELTDALGDGEILLLHEATGLAQDVVRRVLEEVAPVDDSSEEKELSAREQSGDC